MKIHFTHFGDAYLPELQAYSDFVRSEGHDAQIHRRLSTLPNDVKVLWHMCGHVSRELASRYPRAMHIHEYASASIPPAARIKDAVKRLYSPVPNYRIFQNSWVRSRMGFNDEVAFEYRDMGVSSHFFSACPLPKLPEFDFVYLGEMSRLRYFHKLIEALAFNRRSLLLIGNIPDDIDFLLRKFDNITKLGRVAHADVPNQLRRARFGLNLVPAVLPFSRQTSTKLIEYCAAGLPVVSTDYSWAREFEQQHNGQFAYLPRTVSVSAYSDYFEVDLKDMAFAVPDVSGLEWSNIISKMAIWQQIGIVK